MRLALLSALADLPGTPGVTAGERPAFRRFAGKSVLAHQLDCAAHLDCERIICLVATSGPDLAAAKAHAERLGMRFESVDALSRIYGQVTAADDVIVIEDGVLPDRGALVAALADRSAVLSLPADPALDLGFERLDATRAWSGALRTRGDCVARLAELPADCDLASSLLRIALQAGARVEELDPTILADRTWQRRVDRQGNAGTEWRWVARQVALAPFAAPGRALAERIGLRWAQDVGGDRWRRAPHGIALAAGSAATLAGFADRPVIGLVLLFVTSFAIAVASIFERVGALGAPPSGPRKMLVWVGLARDLVMIGLLAAMVMVVPSWLGFVLPLTMTGLLWLGELNGPPRVKPLFADRIALLALLAPAAYLGLSTMALAAVSVLTLALLLWEARTPRKRLTGS